MGRVIYNQAGLDYNGPFFSGSLDDIVSRRAAVLIYVPHTFAEFKKGDSRRGLCRICSFPMADAPCIKEGS